MRATAQDPEAARLMGINVNTTISLTFLLGGALAGAAGLVYAVYETNVWYFQGFQAGLLAFTAAVMGGIGNVRGAVLGGLIIGVIQSLSDSRIGPQWTEAVVFGYLIAIMVLRPAGPARRGDAGGGMSDRRASDVRAADVGAARASRVLVPGAIRWRSCHRRRRRAAVLLRRRERVHERDDHRARLRGDVARAEHRRRHRRPARPGLRRVLRAGRLLARLARLGVLLQGSTCTCSSRRSCPRCRAST